MKKHLLICTVLLGIVTACGEPEVHNPHAKPMPTPTATEPSATAAPTPVAPAPVAPPEVLHKRQSGVEADKALSWLQHGNIRFLKHQLRKDGQGQSDVQRLASGQQPHAIVLSCSDSRVPPEIVFDQKLGEIFVVRTAGEALDATAIASIEYAVEHLGTNLILVMGHTSCGAVAAALGTLDGSDAGSPNLNKLVADIHPRVQQFASGKLSEGLAAEVLANAHGVAKDLLIRSEILRQRVEAGEIKIATAVYHLDSGKVEFE